jgi:hypothetical protein
MMDVYAVALYIELHPGKLIAKYIRYSDPIQQMTEKKFRRRGTCMKAKKKEGRDRPFRTAV